jgi:hypothetical protein
MALFSAIGGMLGAGRASAAGQQAAQMSMLGGLLAAQQQREMFNQGLSFAQPYQAQGLTSVPAINAALGTAPGSPPPTAPLWGQLGTSRIDAAANPFDPSAIGAGYTQSPGYQFMLNRGRAAIDASAAARGGLLSGANIKAQTDYATGLANQDYWNFVNQTQQGMGQDYTQRAEAYNRLVGQEQLGANTANAIFGGAVNSGNAQGQSISSGFSGGAQALSSAGNAAASALSGGLSQAGRNLTTLDWGRLR